MKKVGDNLKLGSIVLIVFLAVLLLIPTIVLGDNEKTVETKTQYQVVYTTDGDYIIYVKGLEKEAFKFAISNSEEYVGKYNSAEDEAGNYVAIISAIQYANMEENSKVYLHIEGVEGCTEINLKDAFNQSMMAEVEETTTRIETELVTEILKQDEEVNGVKVKVTVGGLKITDKAENDAEYYFASTKLPVEKYTELANLAKMLDEDYNSMDMYSKIKTAKEFHNLYTELVGEQKWSPVTDMLIMQPEDAQKGDQYVVFLRKVDGESETVDVKIMTSYREDEEEKIPGRTEIVKVQETAKLPITGDSIVLFVILAVIIIVAIVVFVRMKKLQNKKADK